MVNRHSTPKTVATSEIELPLNSNLEFCEQKIKDNSHCGSINQKYFKVNLDVVSESMTSNTCLNKKISVDIKGNIKNCPSMTKSYGNIETNSIISVLDNSEFKNLWNVRKDDIKTCQRCEFRYICTDYRAYVEDPEDILSKPLKCGYTPYTGEWSEWSSNPLKQKAIVFYEMREMVSTINTKSDWHSSKNIM